MSSSRPAPGDLGRRIAHRREALGLSREELAERAGLDPGYLTYLEERPARPSEDTLLRVARALDVTADRLLGGDAERAPGPGGARATPVLKSLDRQECMRLISPGGVGRVGFDGRSGLIVLPVNYRVHGGAVVFRTRYGGTLDEELNTGVSGVEFKIAFEVDRIDDTDRTGWSVLLHGPAHHVTEDELPEVAHLGVDPWAGGPRELYIRVPVTQVSGRRIIASEET
ncbi:pyridoxamine 5'-phosphate oxidase family protein [Spongiactinospora sp. TRM90649]|uniref:pyridoxamine 5'-phosphate oxidase family protein n=1 Tax=Spongiactinospora sp. TRM90649 TaxID=3031114 RepID=UPI0023F7F9E3|nr:pyridoxamine 5'-phosphate oxidase family protein [Spongiactinospora sp. TRM90649]MDF5754214.1 pyridoxamine 5'-phosphate oxidase family protein [Spongiactinospora sp. TRM90649]